MDYYEFKIGVDTELYIPKNDRDGDIEIRLNNDLNENTIYLPKGEIVKLIEFLKAQI